MSALDSFVAKVTNVQNDISKSFKSWSSKKRIVSKGQYLENVNLDAGADILQKYQDNWAKISKTSAENAKRAQVIEDEIKKIYSNVKEQHDNMKVLNCLLEGLPHVSDSLNITMEKIDLLGDTLEAVEKMLVHLENFCEEEEIHNNKLYHEQQLALYKTKKNEEVEQMKYTQSQKHALKVAAYEKQMQVLLQSKQNAFEKLFQDDLKRYEDTGLVRTDSLSSEPQLDISEISINEDNDTLESFLKIDTYTKPDPDSDISNLPDETLNSPCLEVKTDIDNFENDEFKDVSFTDDHESNKQSLLLSENIFINENIKHDTSDTISSFDDVHQAYSLKVSKNPDIYRDISEESNNFHPVLKPHESNSNSNNDDAGDILDTVLSSSNAIVKNITSSGICPNSDEKDESTHSIPVKDEFT